MAKDLEMGYLLDFYGEGLTEKQREMLRQYYNDDLSLSEIGRTSALPGRARGTPSSMARPPSRSWKQSRLRGPVPPGAGDPG